MQRYSLFGRPCKDACVQLFKVLNYLQERMASTWKSKLGKWSKGAVW
jgi:hypothetical protein